MISDTQTYLYMWAGAASVAQRAYISPGKLMVVGSSPTRGSQFSLKNDCFGCVALPFCCVVVVALPFSASLEVIVDVYVHTLYIIKYQAAIEV